ncbi:MAG: cysteine hydrolase [Actinomycetes bacterium]|jgi:nicotinamidase-related amidase|nr:cysteine hydrolase [Actinomycetes bacterium]
MTKTAVLVIDVLDDAVRGKLAGVRAQGIIAPIKRLLDAARAAEAPVVYCNDAHLVGIDHELELWGPHCLAGSASAAVYGEVAPASGDYVVEKRRYSAFFQTGLALLLKELEVERLVLVGLFTNICVEHTAADAYFWNYQLVVPADAVQAITDADQDSALERMQALYAADITTVDAVAF